MDSEEKQFTESGNEVPDMEFKEKPSPKAQCEKHGERGCVEHYQDEKLMFRACASCFAEKQLKGLENFEHCTDFDNNLWSSKKSPAKTLEPGQSEAKATTSSSSSSPDTRDSSDKPSEPSQESSTTPDKSEATKESE